MYSGLLQPEIVQVRMSASLSTSFDLDRTGILRNSFQKLGVVPPGQDPSTDLLAMGSDALNICLKHWENKGVFLARVERTTQTLVAGTAEYTTDIDTLDIHQRTPFITDNSGVDTRVELITRGRWMAITDKTVQGPPTLIMVEKTDRVRFTLYPVPDSTVASITYPRTRLLTDMDSADNTTGLPSKFLRALILETAIELAPHFGAATASVLPLLQTSLAQAVSEAMNDDTERGNVRLVPRYGIQFGRR
jgi:hypothetical protein